MSNIKWCETWSDTSCVTDGELNLMVEYIKHSALTDFVIYKTPGSCSDTDQVFRFHFDSVDKSYMYGGANAGDDLLIYANSVDSYPTFQMYGSSDVYLKAGTGKKLYLGHAAINSFRFDYASNVSTMNGAGASGDDLLINANTINLCPSLSFSGNKSLYAQVSDAYSFYISSCSDEQFFRFNHNGTISTMYGGANSGDDLVIQGSFADTYSQLTLRGNGSIDINAKANGNINLKAAAVLFLKCDGTFDNISINAVGISADYDLGLFGDGVLCLKETTTPNADANYGKIYCSDNNKCYFQDGAGTEHELAFA